MLCAVAFAALLATGAFASTSLGSRALPSSNITCSPVSNATAVEMVVFDSTNSTASTRLGVTPVQLADPTRAILQAYNDDNQTFTFYSCNTSSLGYISPSLSGEYTVYHGYVIVSKPDLLLDNRLSGRFAGISKPTTKRSMVLQLALVLTGLGRTGRTLFRHAPIPMTNLRCRKFG